MSNDLLLPRVAVLFAAYNGRQWIEQQFNSIFQQRGVSLTAFVSVDQSTDETLIFLPKIGAK